MKKLVTLLLLSSSVLAINSFADTLYVNGKPVSQKVIDQAMNQFTQSSPMAAKQLSNPQFKKELLMSVGMQQAILMEGNSMGLEKSPEYQAKLEEIKPMIYAQMLQARISKGPVTDAEAKAKYEEMKKQMANQQQYEISHILVKDQKTADMIEAKLKAGADFATLAKQYSIDPGSKAKGGDLGWSDGSNYVPAFSAAAKGLKKGEYTTTPVKTQFGYHIIKLNDMKSGNAGSLPPFAKVEDQIKQQIQMERTRGFFDSLKAKYKVEIKN